MTYVPGIMLIGLTTAKKSDKATGFTKLEKWRRQIGKQALVMTSAGWERVEGTGFWSSSYHWESSELPGRNDI